MFNLKSTPTVISEQDNNNFATEIIQGMQFKVKLNKVKAFYLVDIDTYPALLQPDLMKYYPEFDFGFDLDFGKYLIISSITYNFFSWNIRFRY